MAKPTKGDCYIDGKKNVPVKVAKGGQKVCDDGTCSDPKWPGKPGTSAKR